MDCRTLIERADDLLQGRMSAPERDAALDLLEVGAADEDGAESDGDEAAEHLLVGVGEDGAAGGAPAVARADAGGGGDEKIELNETQKLAADGLGISHEAYAKRLKERPGGARRR